MDALARSEVIVRRARPDDRAAAELVFASAAREFTRLAGSPQRARAALARLWPRRGHSASFEFAWVAELDGEPIGVVIGFPARARWRLHGALLRHGLRHVPWVRRIVLPLALARIAAATPAPPRGSFYVSALAVSPAFHRHGVASAFGDPVADHARRAGCSHLACHTGAGHLAARRALEKYGLRPIAGRSGGYVLYLMDLGTSS